MERLKLLQRALRVAILLKAESKNVIELAAEANVLAASERKSTILYLEMAENRQAKLQLKLNTYKRELKAFYHA